MKTTYRIRDWSHYFENNRTREMKEMSWVPVPNRMDGDGYTELVSHSDGAAHLGAWLAILQIASKCPARGVLMRDGERPHDASSLARISRLSVEVFETALPRLVEIGWLEAVPQEDASLSPFVQADAPQEGAVIPQEGAEAESAPANAPQEGAPSRARAERNGRERKGREKHTHVEHSPARAHARDGPAEAPSARVCVSSELTFEDFEGYARSEPGFHNPRGWAMKAFPKRDPVVVNLVAGWKARRAEVLEGRAPPGESLTPFHVAARAVASVASVPNCDVAGYIGQMRDVSEETRGRLREKFCGGRAAAG